MVLTTDWLRQSPFTQLSETDAERPLAFIPNHCLIQLVTTCSCSFLFAQFFQCEFPGAQFLRTRLAARGS